MPYATGFIAGDRYYATVVPFLGVCCYTVEGRYAAQMMPIPGYCEGQTLCQCFMHFSLTLAGERENDNGYNLRNHYRYFLCDDVLTLQCLLLEALEHWRAINAKLENCDPYAGAGKGVG